MKQHLFYTFLTIFIFTALVTLLGITQVITIEDKYLTPLFTALLIELVGAVIAMYKGVNFFEEPTEKTTYIDRQKLGSNESTLSSDDITRKELSSVNLPEYVQSDAIDLDDYFEHLNTVEDRFRERSELKKSTNGKSVYFQGKVDSVSGSSNSGCKIRMESASKKRVFVDIPEHFVADAFSLRQGDIIFTQGIVNTDLESSTSIEAHKFERVILNSKVV